MFEVAPLVAYISPPSSALTPAQVQSAYGFSKIKFGTVVGDGTGQTIAIVDAMDDPNIQADLNTFDAQFGLPSTTITRVNQTGGTSYPATDSTGGWESEMCARRRVGRTPWRPGPRSCWSRPIPQATPTC